MFERRRMHTQTDVTKNIWEIEKRVCRHFFLEDLSDKHPVRSTRTCSLSSIFWNSSPDLQQNHFLRSLVLEGEKKERIPLFIRLSRVFFLSCLTKKKKRFFPLGRRRQRRRRRFIPNHQRWYAKWKLSWNTCTFHTRFRAFGNDLYAQSVLSKFLHRSLVGRLLTVRCWLGTHFMRTRVVRKKSASAASARTQLVTSQEEEKEKEEEEEEEEK